jgi:5-hydroxyisourate hydrolase-like protein (transthyretin family)
MTPSTPVILSKGRRGDRSRRICVSSFCGKVGKPQSLVYCIVVTALLAISFLPAHPQSHPSATGLFRIAGKVVNSVTGEPVRRATVSALAEADSHTVASAVTDSDGHFAMENLSAAKYQLTASRRGFRTAFYDEHDEYNSAIVTGPDQETASLIFRLTPGSVLRGVITADGGDPVKDADVMLFRKPQGRKLGERIAQAGSTTTDDTGAYEFGNLAPGEYLLSVQAEPWYAMHPHQTRPASDPATIPDLVYELTYFDSTTDEAQASTIVLAGGNREEADFNLHAVPALHITLEAPRAEDGTNAAFTPTLQHTIFGATYTQSLPSPFYQAKTIQFDGVAPGHYELALADPPRVFDLDATVSQLVDINSGTPTVTVSGTLQTPSGSALTGEFTVSLHSLDSSHRLYKTQSTYRSTFSFASVPPGAWELGLESQSSNQIMPILSISAGSRARFGNQVTVRDRPLSLLVTTGLGETNVEGFARINGKGVPGVMMVLVPRSKSGWQALLRRDQSNSDGSFSLHDVVTGQYTVVAIQDGWTLDWTDPQVLARYLPAGIGVTVTGASGKLITLDRPVPVQTR